MIVIFSGNLMVLGGGAAEAGVSAKGGITSQTSRHWMTIFLGGCVVEVNTLMHFARHVVIGSPEPSPAPGVFGRENKRAWPELQAAPP